jgi:DNA-binding NtrC family response regulator
MFSALLLCRDPDTIVGLTDAVRESGFVLDVVGSLEEARAAMLRDAPDVALMDSELLGADGLTFVEESRLSSIIELFLITDDPKLSEAVRGMRAGVSDYLSKPVDPEKLREGLRRIVEASGAPQADGAAGFGIMQGESPPMQRLFKILRKVSATGMTVLLVGESGVGKELAASIVHELSDRSGGPLVPINCGAISPEILESELFGHEKGSFTGASRRHAGFFERAEGGTLFLDEITEMAPELQVRLLRVLESGQLRRVGGESDMDVDVRVVAATNRDPDDAVEAGLLREDLYYRLAQFPVRVPSLRERGDDILLLARQFLSELVAKEGVVKSFSDDVLEILRLHTWPGNVRELKNTIGRAFVLAGPEIQPDDLPPGVVEGGPIDATRLRIAVGAPLAEVERRAILATVAHFEGDKKQAAKALGISLKTLYTRLKKYRGD